MNLANLLMRTARVFPDRPAIVHGERELYDYQTLARRVCALSAGLRQQIGLGHGHRVGLLMHNCPQYLEILYAIWHAGLVAVPMNHKLHPREVDYILEDSGCALLFVDTATGAALAGTSQDRAPIVDVDGAEYRALFKNAEAAEPQGEAALAWLFYTSGTTGKPKGVMLSHGNLLTMTLCYFADVDIPASGDSILYAAPMSHGAGLYNFPHVLVGARHLIPQSGAFAPEEIFNLAGRYGDVSFFAAPTMVRRLVEHAAAKDADSSGIKSVIYGGGPMYVEDIRRALDVMGNRFVQIYGQGESPMTITALSKFHLGNSAHPRYLERLSSVGLPQSVVEVRVLDADDQPLPPGESGEIAVRGPTVMAGYWNNPAASQNTLRNGWLHTGDIGVFDQDGFLTMKDRSKDVIISGGSNIYPREVEEVLLSHPQVAEVSVVGRPCPEWGEEVVAFVVCERDARLSPATLDALCLAQIARFKRPKEYRMVTSLPKNNYGKVLKTQLRQWLADEVI
ncbi:MAG: long-chain fatty acid--CoA ligase [Rhodocyclaceae bacterium]|nr:MAG: long-chain fatty acid--CoA ligase [Rhodocyclaceae bacterium]